jgi:hypothetical protein
MKTKLLVSIGAEGGCIAIYGNVSDAAHPRYRVVVVDERGSHRGGSGVEGAERVRGPRGPAHSRVGSTSMARRLRYR